MKVLIIEDEHLAAKRIVDLLKRYDSEIEVLDVIASVQKSIKWFNENPHPDIAFFDIQLSDGQSFEIFEKVEINCPIIFTTAFDEYAIKAFKVNSLDYLLKPLDYDELKAALEKYKNVYKKSEAEISQQKTIENMLQMLTKQYKNRFIVKVGPHIKPVEIEDILYFYSMEKASFLCTSAGKRYVTDYSLEQIENMINPENFFRINRKYILSLKSINDIVSYTSSRLKIKLKHSDDSDVIVSREKVKKFKEWLGD